MTWQPIETAPRDGTVVLLSNERGVVVPGSYIHKPISWSRKIHKGPHTHILKETGKFEGWMTTSSVPISASHWMPLPDPPSD